MDIMETSLRRIFHKWGLKTYKKTHVHTPGGQLSGFESDGLHGVGSSGSQSLRETSRPVDSLKEALQKAWDEFNAPYLRAAVGAFPKRLKACIDADGDTFESQCCV
ncbi:unnamed protein product [Heligmosomoides polygyrus]|uniref:GLOBIN domain-containing protein n=1 Tax=Heligmosomoides polygyrus TaxID=6339 RepID=A0A183FPA5_HELPZ|nr:unnamed protein product [Heligmosomoides polygyrus]